MNLLRGRILICIIINFFIILPVCSTAGTNKPAIDCDSYGVVERIYSYGSHADAWIKVLDHDGISSDGTSHTVSVKCPDDTVHILSPDYPISDTVYAYSGSAGDIQTGDYTITVVDSVDTHTVEVIDTIASYSLGVPDQTSFAPVNGTTTIDTTPTFSWDSVVGANHYRVRIYKTDGSNETVWKGYIGNTTSYEMPPGILLPGTTYKYRISARDGHQGIDIDHYSVAPAFSDDYITFTTGSQDNAPHIDFDSSGAQTWNDESSGEHFSFWIKVYDAQGSPDDIKEVTVTTPAGDIIPMYLDYQESPNCAAFHIGPHGILSSGTYTFEVVDQSGNTAIRTEYLDANPIGYPSKASITGTLSGSTGTSLSVDWEDVPEAAFYRLEIYNSEFSRIHRFATTSSEYTVPEGFLKAGERYRYTITTRREFFDQNVDNGSRSHGWDDQWPTIVPSPIAGTHTPTIDIEGWGVLVWHSPNPDPETSVASPYIYRLCFDAQITDDDGLHSNYTKLIVTYPDGTTTIDVAPEYCDDAAVSANYWNFYPTSLASIQNGTYTFTVTDTDGNTAIATDELVVNLLDCPTNVKPEKNSSVCGAQPTFRWDSITDASKYRVQIYSGNTRIHLSALLTDNFYRVPSDLLEKNELYNYRIYAFREAFDDVGVDLDNLSTTMLPSGDRPYFRTTKSAGFPGINLLLLE